MRRYQKRQLTYGVTSGIFAFGCLWLLAALFLPDTPSGPDWKASLRLLLGMHFIEIKINETFTGAPVTSDATAVFTDAPVQQLRLVPPVAVAVAAAYAAREVSQTRRPQYILKNGASVLAGYLAALLVAFVVSDIRPDLTFAVLVILALGVALYLGSTVLSRLTGALPFFGVTSLGTIILVGLVVLVFGIRLLQVFGPALLVTGVATVAGSSLVIWHRDAGIDPRSALDEYKVQILLFLLLALGLYVALSNPELG